jgi:hypothetical protein
LILDNCDDRIDIPKGFILKGLEIVQISYADWNKVMIEQFLTWLAEYVPNLKTFLVYVQTRENAILFMNGLLQNGLFIEKFKDSLESILFIYCNLIEEDLLSIMFDMRPLYAKLSILDLSNNNVEGLHTIGSAAKVLKKNDPISSKLECLYLDNNPALNNLNSPETPDHDAMVCI